MAQAIEKVELAIRQHGKFSKEYAQAIKILEKLINSIENK